MKILGASMKILGAVAMLALLLAGAALAQGIKPPAPTDPPKSPNEIQSEKAADSAYKRSLRNIPDQPAADPWGGARAVEPPKSAAAPPAKRTKTSTGGTVN